MTTFDGNDIKIKALEYQCDNAQSVGHNFSSTSDNDSGATFIDGDFSARDSICQNIHH